jgi:signal transduction histidine kinase
VICDRADDDGVVIDVIDQGEGISRDDQERIFHEFVQLGKTQLQDGTGLGLPISRRLAELLRGSLSVQSTSGQGSTFRLQLPPKADSRNLRLVEQELAREPARELEIGRPPAESERRPATGTDAARS